VNDLGLDGIDIDFEKSPLTTGINTDELKCDTDPIIIGHINSFRSKLDTNKLLTAAVFSVGAYGTSHYPNTKYLPSSKFAGMWVNPLKQVGHKLDTIFIMSYDAGNEYKPTSAFKAYKSIFSKNIVIGLEIPPETWGGHKLTVEEALEIAKYSKEHGGKGIFFWSLQKREGSTTINTYIKPLAQLLKLPNSDKPLPLN